MVKELVHDPILLAMKSETAAKDDLQTVQDLTDTLSAHKDSCVGMAANMIGVRKRIIVFDNGGEYMTMLNPEILKRSEPYETEEGCLSLLGGPRNAKDISPSRLNGRRLIFKHASRPLQALPHR